MSKTPRTDAVFMETVDGDSTLLTVNYTAAHELCRELEVSLSDELNRGEEIRASHKRLTAATPCPKCEEPVYTHLGFRCVDCQRLYHRECLRQHCLGEAEQKLRESTDYAGPSRRLLLDALPIVQAYASANPCWTHGLGPTQDPNGAHAWLNAYAALAAGDPERARDSANEGNSSTCATETAATGHSPNPVHAVVPGFPNIREWCRGSPTSIVITFVDDITSEQMAAIPKALMDALYRRHSQVHPQPGPIVDSRGLVGGNTLTFRTTGACEKCGKPVYPPTNRYQKSAMCLGNRIWHGECFPPEGVSESFPAQRPGNE